MTEINPIKLVFYMTKMSGGEISPFLFLFIYCASQKFTVEIIKDLQYTNETLRFKITSLLWLRLHGRMTYK